MSVDFEIAEKICAALGVDREALVRFDIGTISGGVEAQMVLIGVDGDLRPVGPTIEGQVVTNALPPTRTFK